MKNIEAEVRGFISKEQHGRLLEFFRKSAEFVGEDDQETYYFDTNEDLRIQRNSSFSKIWLKKGKIHDDSREEVEIRFRREDFEKLESLFISLGFKVQVKWFRKRNEFLWDDITVCLDFTKGYGHIIEMEKMCSEGGKEKVLAALREKFSDLGIRITPKEEFDTRFRHYKENWRELVKG